MITLTLNYSADFTRAEYYGDSRWLPLGPDADGVRDAQGWLVHGTPMDQLLCDKGGLHLSRGTRYRAPSRLLSHLPPFRSVLTRLAPSPIALDLGLLSPDYAGDGFIYMGDAPEPPPAPVYLSAASHSTYVHKDTILMIGHHTISDADAIEGACMALRRAGLLTQAETLHLAAEHSRARALSVLNCTIDNAPFYLALRPPAPPDQLDPARGLMDDLTTARKIMMGEALT